MGGRSSSEHRSSLITGRATSSERGDRGLHEQPVPQSAARTSAQARSGTTDPRPCPKRERSTQAQRLPQNRGSHVGRPAPGCQGPSIQCLPAAPVRKPGEEEECRIRSPPHSRQGEASNSPHRPKASDARDLLVRPGAGGNRGPGVSDGVAMNQGSHDAQISTTSTTAASIDAEHAKPPVSRQGASGSPKSSKASSRSRSAMATVFACTIMRLMPSTADQLSWVGSTAGG